MRSLVEPDGEITAINVAPLVDVVLVLLVILMVSGVVLSRAIPLDASGGGDAEAPTTLWIRVDGGGALEVDGVPARWDELEALAAAARDRRPDVRAALRVDPEAPHEVFVRALDALRRAEIRRYGLVSSAP